MDTMVPTTARPRIGRRMESRLDRFLRPRVERPGAGLINQGGVR
ncbi:hypothetical protein [Streptacidiphilus sp. P02-A3a]|nr:hypothetical protein [Streptacidiphilus sp. P02-A3a]